MSLAFPNTVLNTIVAEAIDELSDQLEGKISTGEEAGPAIADVIKEAYSANKQVCFGGDNYSDEWHAEAEQRGLKNLRTTPDALPEVVADDTVAAFERYKVLSRRELESRFEVWVEQYTTLANIEAETAASMAKTMILPAAVRYLGITEAAGVSALDEQVRPLVNELIEEIGGLESANLYPDGVEGIELAEYARDNQLTAMAKVREIADRLEKVVADDLWPLPKYSEVLFVR
jgi:glutamine synthetase